MGNLSEVEECRFFDASEDIASISNASPESNEIDSCYGGDNLVGSSFQYDVWVRSPKSVQERRSKFLDWMTESLDQASSDSFVDATKVGRINGSSGAVLRAYGFEEEFRSSRSSMSCWSNDNVDLLEENFVCRDGNLGGGMVTDLDEMGQDGKTSDGQEMDSENNCGSLCSFQQHLDEGVEKADNSVGIVKMVKKGWLNRLLSLSCAMDKQGEAEKLRPNEDDALLWSRVQRVKVRQCKKRLKELSALYKGQEIQAHEGSILTMKFSPDGQYLASAGEDRVVRLWQVVVDERLNEQDIPEIDPSCIYFTVNHLSELKPLFLDKEKMSISRTLRRTSDSACVIFPPKVFRILEKPLHEFHGHSSDILDLSWSKNNYLLSSSADNTVRLWRVGSDHCLRVFPHSNYVTCVQFNPIDDNYFMSGSIDGKIRIWAISDCHVVDWADVRDIVTAVCYRPDGQGGIVGCMMGNCRFYSMSDNHLQLDAEICLHSKKKSPCKRITGFQFLPQDSSKVMVTCADSQVRILQGLNVIGKYKGVAGNQLSACFTSDGKHMVSACEDSNVYIWNSIDQEEPATEAKNIRSWERFTTNASIAIPWCGLKCRNPENEWQFNVSGDDSAEILSSFSPARFNLSQEYFLESFPKGSATWPEEKLPALNPLSSTSPMHKSQYKFLKSSCQSTSSSHAWGLVIVTAGWDGRIRSFHNYGLPVPV
ncbi:WD repeat-containing protein 44-like [Pistacia vera]|uniref:WD repeat-containing protein 44-like n=1 Tax=Pistacia vera TaxID=55513 RepID=UPI001263D03C|nr:WD repeat-containing protein 44-like [Pistacia vera]